MGFCSITGCKSNNRRSPELSFFSFPKCEKIRSKWLIKCSGTKPINLKSSRVCSRHFTEDDLDPSCRIKRSLGLKKSRLFLKENAIPSLYLSLSDVDLDPDESDDPHTPRLEAEALHPPPASRLLEIQPRSLEVYKATLKQQSSESNRSQGEPVLVERSQQLRTCQVRLQQLEAGYQLSGGIGSRPDAETPHPPPAGPLLEIQPASLDVDKPTRPQPSAGSNRSHGEPVLVERSQQLRTRRLRVQQLEVSYQLSGGGKGELLVLREPANSLDLVTRLRKHKLPAAVETMPPTSLAQATDYIHQLRVQNLALREEMFKWAIRQRKLQNKKAQDSEEQLAKTKTHVIKRRRLRELEAIEAGIRDIFTEQQVKAMLSGYHDNCKVQKKVVHWREEDMRKTAELRAASSNDVVNFVRHHLRIPLPCPATVQNRLHFYPALKQLWKETNAKIAKKETRCAMCQRQLNIIHAVASGEMEQSDTWDKDRLYSGQDQENDPPYVPPSPTPAAELFSQPELHRHRKRPHSARPGLDQMSSSRPKQRRRRRHLEWSSDEEYDRYPVPSVLPQEGQCRTPLDGYQPPSHIWSASPAAELISRFRTTADLT